MKLVRLECSNGNTFEIMVEAETVRKALLFAIWKMPRHFTDTRVDALNETEKKEMISALRTMPVAERTELLDVPEVKYFVDGEQAFLDA